MAEIMRIDWQTDPSSFLNPSTTTELAQDFIDGSLSSKVDEIIGDLASEMDRGLSAEALCLEGCSPLNELSQELSAKMQDDCDSFVSVGNQIISDGNKHTSEEVNTYYDRVMDEYNKRKALLRTAVESYNGSREVPVESGEKDSDGNVKTETLPEIKLINGEDDNYKRVIISGERSPRSDFYSTVAEALASVEELYPKPEEANKYRAMWGNLSSSGDAVKTSSEKTTTTPKGEWTSYGDAVAAGFPGIMTLSEFAGRKTDYSSYQEYLDAMYDKYVTNGTSDMKYQPEYKTGSFDPILRNNDYSSVTYDGEYIEFKNYGDIVVRAPLAIAKYEDGKVVYVPMTEQQKKDYTRKITQYYNDAMSYGDAYSDKFKSEIGDRVDSMTFVYIDPASKDKIDDARDWAGFCRSVSHFTKRSDIVYYSSEFINLDDIDDSMSYDYMVNNCYNHELGHAYGNDNVLLVDRDELFYWNQAYERVKSDEANKQILREYSLTNQKELFADATAYYYSDPDRLKQVDVDIEVPFVGKFETLYDYMDWVLN